MADWLESSMLSVEAQPATVSDSQILDILREAEIQDHDAHLENIIKQVRSRASYLGSQYPIRRHELGFGSKNGSREDLVYRFLLFVSLNQAYQELAFRKGSANIPAELFEDLTLIALKRYAGGDAIRFGAPRRNPVPSSFPKAIEYLASTIFEAIGARDIERQETGDDGLDIVAWLAFGDKRSSQLMLLAQCAIGTDWKNKRSELDLALWRRHVDWHSEPLRVFSVPFHHELGGSWRETATRGGIIFDRLRIAKLAVGRSLSTSLNGRIRSWLKKRVSATQALALT